jgi:predicted ATPase
VIHSWKVENFKSLRQAEIGLANLNIILGSNSVGKSSLLHSLLILSQVVMPSPRGKSRQLVGTAVDLGSWEMIHHRKPGGAKSGPMAFEAELRDLSYLKRAGYRLELIAKDPKASEAEASFEEITFFARERVVKLQFSPVEEASNNERELTLEIDGERLEGVARELVDDATGRGEFAIAPWFALFLGFCSNDSLSRQKLLSKRQKGSLNPVTTRELTRSEHFSYVDYVPGFLSCSPGFVAGVDSYVQALISELEDGRLVLHGLWEPPMPDGATERFSLEQIFAALRRLKDSGRGKPNFSAAKEQFWAASNLGLREVALIRRRLSLSFRHLGPLRVVSPALQRNSRSPSLLTPIGSSGEHLAYELYSQGFLKANYPRPSGREGQCTLVEAINDWVEFLGITGELKTELVPGFTTKITLDDKLFTQLGSGISQIVPVISILLLAAREKDSAGLVLIEQPELHMHPNLQSKLADMFVAFAKSGVRLLIETHSEYLVTRLRLLIAKGEIQPELVSLLFAEQKEADYAEIRRASLTAKGGSDYWPAGFHTDSMLDRFELTAIQMQSDD